MGRAPGRGCRDARGVPPRSGAGPRFLRRAAGASSARSGPMPRTRRWRGSTREWPGELLLVTQNVDDLHERAGSKRLLHMHGELKQRLVPGVRRALRLGRADGRGRDLPELRQAGPGAARHRLVRRDAVRDGADRRGAARLRPVRVDRHVGRGLSGRRASSRPRAIAARGRSRSTSSRARAACSSTKAGSARRGSWCRRGSRRCSALVRPLQPDVAVEASGPRPSAG